MSMNSLADDSLDYFCTTFLSPASLLPFPYFSFSLCVPSLFALPCLYVTAHQTALVPMQLTAEMPCAITAIQLLAVLGAVLGH